ncbi:Proteophosphoglycan ppg4 [Rhodotorula toruloides ATCC 204091]|nr:Proteophosphoglycan ppg4 [Rhodotorula toruloides ATCC 204091]
MKSRAPSGPSLLDLPVELLDRIFGYAYWIDLTYENGRYRPISICRALQPSLDRVRYRTIPFLSSAESASLLRTVETRPELGASCRRIHLSPIWDGLEEGGVMDVDYDTDVVSRLLSRMPALRWLEFYPHTTDIGGALSLASEDSLPGPLGNIETLVVKLRLPNDAPPKLTHIGPLLQCCRLTTLAFNCIVDDPVEERMVTSGGQACPSLVHLKLVGDLHKADVQELLQSAANLSNFSFTDFETPTLIRGLALPANKDCVRSLYIDQGYGDDGEPIDLATVIQCFPGIQHLTLKVGNLQLSTEAIRILRTRPRLDSFSLWLVPCELARLTTFLDGLGPAHAPQYVDFESQDFYWSRRGRLPHAGDRIDLSDTALQSHNSWFRWNGWRVPCPLGDSERRDPMWQLREEATRCGTMLTGNVADAAYVQEEYDHMLDDLRRRAVSAPRLWQELAREPTLPPLQPPRTSPPPAHCSRWLPAQIACPMSSARRNDRQVEASLSPPAVDRLSKLPMELLQKIFDDAYASAKPTEPLSRTLLPLFDRCVWRDVRIIGDKRLAAFCATFQTRPSAGRHCRSLKIEHLKSAAVSHQSLETVFTNLPNLVKLVIHGDSDTLLDVLLPSGRQAAFPFSSTIRHFACLCKTQRADPYNPAYLGSLASMTGLTVLELIFQHRSRVKTSCSRAHGGALTLPPLDVLSVSTSRGPNLDSLRLLLEGVPAVKTLVVKHYEESSSLVKLVSALAAPEHLEQLCLRASSTSRSALPTELKQLRGLKRITFRGNFSHLSRDSFDVLRALPLERIEVGKKSDISAIELSLLVDGPRKLRSLKKLRLDNVDGKAGDIEDLSFEHLATDIDPIGWDLPKWTSSFAYEDFLVLQKTAGRGNVAISGTVKNAARVERKWETALSELEDELLCDSDFYDCEMDEEYWLGEDGPAADTPNLSHPLPTLHRLLAATRDNLDNSALSRRRRSPPASSINLGDSPDSPLNDGDLVAHVHNGGIYAILAQFLVISVVAGVLCFAAPSIVSVTTPSFLSYILGVLCFAVAAGQPFGFFGVYREKPRLFKAFLRINGLLVTASILLSLAIIIISAVQHSKGVDSCTMLFGTDNADSTAKNICNIWTWIQIGIMGLLFAIVALCEFYFVFYTSIYASEQRLDHARYDSVYSTAQEEIRQSGLWDGASMGRPSYSQDELAAPGYPLGHGRNASKSSGLRNEVARGDEEEYLAEGGRGQGGKLRKGGGGGGGRAPLNATSVVGYQDEEYAPYDYANPTEQGFRPPYESSQMHGQQQRW